MGHGEAVDSLLLDGRSLSVTLNFSCPKASTSACSLSFKSDSANSRPRMCAAGYSSDWNDSCVKLLPLGSWPQSSSMAALLRPRPAQTTSTLFSSSDPDTISRLNYARSSIISYHEGKFAVPSGST